MAKESASCYLWDKWTCTDKDIENLVP